MQTTRQQLEKELKILVNKWKDKPEAPFMSREYIDRKFDRIKYRDLKKKINMLQVRSGIYEMAKKIFEA